MKCMSESASPLCIGPTYTFVLTQSSQRSHTTDVHLTGNTGSAARTPSPRTVSSTDAPGISDVLDERDRWRRQRQGTSESRHDSVNRGKEGGQCKNKMEARESTKVNRDSAKPNTIGTMRVMVRDKKQSADDK